MNLLSLACLTLNSTTVVNYTNNEYIGIYFYIILVNNNNFSFADYIPGQFAAFTTTFGINTLSDIKTVNTKIQLKMVEAVTAKKDAAETVEILNNAMKNIRIDSSNDSEVKQDEKSTESAVAATAASEGMKNNPNVYIPNQYQVLSFY